MIIDKDPAHYAIDMRLDISFYGNVVVFVIKVNTIRLTFDEILVLISDEKQTILMQWTIHTFSTSLISVNRW